jgi:hypothetical protein
VIQVLCLLQDGTARASLELKNDKARKAFGIGETETKKFRDYCLRFGTFMHPSSQVNYLYKDIVSVFKKNECWSQMIFYCKPYYKSTTYEKKGTGLNSNFGAGLLG